VFENRVLRRMIKRMRMRWVEYVARMWEKKNAYRILVGKPEGKRSLGDIGWGGMDWIDLAEDRDQWGAFVDTAMNLRDP
jgi:hypothetical protein